MPEMFDAPMQPAEEVQPSNPPAATALNLIEQHVHLEASRTECCLPHLWWAGASTLAATCGRSVWTRLMGPSGPKLHPNLYVVLVGDPGQGKTLAVRSASSRFQALKIHTAADSITGAKLISWAAIASAKRIGEGRDPGLTIALETLDSLFARKSDQQMKAFLSAAFDCKEEYSQDTQIRGKEPIQKLCLNLIAAATPSHLSSCFLPTDWGEGLASRFLFILGGPGRIEDLDAFDSALDAAYLARLVALRGSLHGGLEVGWTQDAWTSRIAWRKAQNKTLPPHPHASGYWHNRHTFAVKMSMLMAIAAGESTISSTAWNQALEALGNLEATLATTLAHTGGNPYAGIVASVLKWALAEGRILDEWEVRRRLSDFIAPQYIQATIDSMLASHQMLEVADITGPQASPNRRMIHPHLKNPGAKVWDIVKARAKA